MNIAEAAALAVEGKAITRTSWKTGYVVRERALLCFTSFNAPLCTAPVLYRAPCSWTPTPEDLMATDWIVKTT